MNRSLIAQAILPALLLQLAPPATAFAAPGREHLDAAGVTDKNPTRPSPGTPQRVGDDKAPTRPSPGTPQRMGDNKDPGRPTPRPIPRVDEPDGSAGPGRRGRIQRFDYEAPNGFRIDVVAWPARAGGYTAAATLSSPSGERMTFEMAPAAGFGPAVLIDGEIVVSYDTDRRGRLRRLTVHDGERAVSSLAARGGHSGAGEAYLHLARSVAARHSPEFLSGMQVALRSLQHDAVAPANLREFLECALGATGYVLSVWGLIAGCVVGGVPTLGASCILAIIAHEVAVASAILACFPE